MRQLPSVFEITKVIVLRLLLGIGRCVGRPRAQSIDRDRITRILVIGLGGIGDAIRLFPSIQTLRLNFPKASLTLLTSCPSDVLALLSCASELSEVIHTETGGGFTHLPAKCALIRALRRRNFDLVFNPSRGHGFIENDLRSFLIGAPVRLGFYQQGAGFLHTHALEFRQDHYMVDQILDLLAYVGITPRERELSIRIPREAVQFARSFLADIALSSHERLIVVHPGTKDLTRRWHAVGFHALIQQILRVTSARVLLIGDADERSLVQEVLSNCSDSRVHDCTGRTTIAQTAALLSRTDVFVGNDSAPLHLAIALGIPTIGLFGPTSARQIMPNDIRFIPVNSCRLVRECRLSYPCYIHQPIFGRPQCVQLPCINSITASEVWSMLESLLVHKRLPASIGVADQ